MKSAAIAVTLTMAARESCEAGSGEVRPPVLLLHGFMNTERNMQPLARFLRAQGREVHTLTLAPSWGQIGIDGLAGQVKTFADEKFKPGQSFDLVGFSMGGLVARYYLQRLGGLERVHRFVTISSPHQGSSLAWMLPNAGGRDMRPGSALLTDLERDADQLAKVGFTSIWTPLDLTILPARSSVIPSAKCQQLLCVAHPLMVYDKRCFKAVASALES